MLAEISGYAPRLLPSELIYGMLQEVLPSRVPVQLVRFVLIQFARFRSLRRHMKTPPPPPTKVLRCAVPRPYTETFR